MTAAALFVHTWAVVPSVWLLPYLTLALGPVALLTPIFELDIVLSTFRHTKTPLSFVFAYPSYSNESSDSAIAYPSFSKEPPDWTHCTTSGTIVEPTFHP